ncbi:MAG: FecR domain-containing protein [Deltaproteobacteria bacterium]|nr:FecR domain-containing protein [Deltaproteobacteria bacterium]
MIRNTVTAAVLLGALCLLSVAGAAAAGEAIGVVRTASGDATVTRGEKTLPAAPGLRILVGDTLGTGPDGSLGVILRDDSSLSIGPGSRLVLRRFQFSPSEEKFDLVARITRGTMAYLSGLIGKLAPEKARFETPTATIGIRGTRFALKVGEPSSR